MIPNCTNELFNFKKQKVIQTVLEQRPRDLQNQLRKKKPPQQLQSFGRLKALKYRLV